MYICTKCRGKNVEALGWIDLNTGESDNENDEVGEYYCRDCGSHTDVEYVSSLFDEDLADEVSLNKLTKQSENNEENNS